MVKKLRVVVEKYFASIRIKLLILSSCFFLSVVQAQERKYTFDKISVNQGLSQNSIFSIFKDHRGFVWFGTNDGLNRYDGHEINVFRGSDVKGNSLLNSTITDIVEDVERDRIYIATAGGLSVFNPSKETFTNYQVQQDSNSILSDYLFDLEIDEEGTVWMANSYGLSAFHPDSAKFTNYQTYQCEDGEIKDASPLSLLVSSTNEIWLGTFGQGLIKIGRNGHDHQMFLNKVFEDKFFESNIIHCIVALDENYLLVGTDNGCFNVSTQTGEYEASMAQGLSVTRVIKGVDDDFWIGTKENGLLHVDKNGNQEKFTNNRFDSYSIPENYISSLFIDDTNLLWIGTHNSGVVKMPLQPNFFQHYYNVPDENSVYGNAVFTFEQDVQGNVWIGTSQGVTKWYMKENRFEHIDIFKDGKDYSIWKIFSDPIGIVWIGSSNGLIKYDVVLDKVKLYDNIPGDSTSLPSNDVFDLERDAQDRLWVGTSYGLCRMDEEKGTFKVYKPNNHRHSISGASIWDIKCDTQGRLWIGTEDGLNLYDYTADQFTVLKHEEGNPNSILSNRVNAISEGLNNKIWVSTDKGIDCIEEDLTVSIQYTEDTGLLNGFVYSVFENGESLWFSTNRGISKLNRKTGEILNFDSSDGVQDYEFNPAAIELFDGSYLMGGINGFNKFHPDSLKLSKYKPPIYFTGLYLYDKDGAIRDARERENVFIKNSLITASKIRLSHDERFLTLKFAALGYKNPQKIEYFYRLKPSFQNWIPLQNENQLSFVDLRPGDYQLEVRSSNSDGYLCDNIRKIEIVVIPPFWDTAWFIALLSFSILFIIFLLVKYRIHKVRKEKEMLAQTVKKKTHDLQIQSSIAHKQRDEIARQKKQLEESAQSLEIKVKERTAQLEKAKLAAEESDRLKSAFLSNMSHEIRTPMNAIIGFSDLLLDPSLNPKERLDFAGMIKSNGDELLNLLNDIIDISMIESEQIITKVSSFSVNKVITEVFYSFINSKYLVDKDELELKLDIPDTELTIQTDPFRLKQVLKNLVNNALKFTTQGHVKLGYHLIDGHVRFFVEDTGIGIDEVHQRIIFERFLKVKNDVSNLYRGNGLGLTISKNLVELLGGTIGLSSQEGIGSCFYFHIPIKQ